MLERKHYNRIVAELLEPDPPEIDENKLSSFSPDRGWYRVEIYEEGDIPRWEPRNFDMKFDSAMEAYEKLCGACIDLYKDSVGWEAFDDHIPELEEDKIFGTGYTAAKAIVSLIINSEEF